jgi:hypothetical protein
VGSKRLGYGLVDAYSGKTKSLAADRTRRSKVPASHLDVRTPYMKLRVAIPKRVRGARNCPARTAPFWHPAAYGRIAFS